MTDFEFLLQEKDIKKMNQMVFNWIEKNIVQPNDFLNYLERVKRENDQNGQCGAAIDYLCEKLIKQGQLNNLIDDFCSSSMHIMPVLGAIVINTNRSVEQFFNAVLDHEDNGPYILNQIAFTPSIAKFFWHPKFAFNPNIQRSLKHNCNLASAFLSCWNSDTDKKTLRSLAQQGYIAPYLLLAQLKVNPKHSEELLPHWIEMFPQYIQTNAYEIADHLSPEAFERFIDRIVSQPTAKFAALCLHKFGPDFHKTTQHICAHIQWNSEMFEQLYSAAVCEHWQPHQFNESLFSLFVKFWLTNAPEHAQHHIDDYIRYTGEGFDTYTQSLIEHMRIGHSVGSAGLDISKRKM